MRRRIKWSTREIGLSSDPIYLGVLYMATEISPNTGYAHPTPTRQMILKLHDKVLLFAGRLNRINDLFNFCFELHFEWRIVSLCEIIVFEHTSCRFNQMLIVSEIICLTWAMGPLAFKPHDMTGRREIRIRLISSFGSAYSICLKTQGTSKIVRYWYNMY